MREEGHLGRQAKAADLFGRHGGNARQQFCVGVLVHIGVGNEQGAVLQHQGIEGGKARRAARQANDVVHMLEVRIELPHQATQHGIGIAQVNRQSANQGVGAAHGRFRCLGRHAPAPHQAVVSLPVLTEAGIAFGVDAGHVHAQLHAQASLDNAGFDHCRAANQDGLGNAFFDRHLRRAQHALVFPFGKGHALALGRFGGLEHGTHDHAGLVHEA